MLSCCKFVQVTGVRGEELIYTLEELAFSHYNAQSQSYSVKFHAPYG